MAAALWGWALRTPTKWLEFAFPALLIVLGLFYWQYKEHQWQDRGRELVITQQALDVSKTLAERLAKARTVDNDVIHHWLSGLQVYDQTQAQQRDALFDDYLDIISEVTTITPPPKTTISPTHSTTRERQHVSKPQVSKAVPSPVADTTDQRLELMASGMHRAYCSAGGTDADCHSS